jgi:hypothetical protein
LIKTKIVALSVATLAPYASAVRDSTTAKRLSPALQQTQCGAVSVAANTLPHIVPTFFRESDINSTLRSHVPIIKNNGIVKTTAYNSVDSL